MEAILKKVQVHIPFTMLREGYLDLFLKRRINPEISFSAETLARHTTAEFAEMGTKLAAADLTVTLHGPFMDLRPGAIDPEIRRVSRDRIAQAVTLSSLFHPKTIVCHPSFDHRYYVSTLDQWVANSVETWSYLAGLLDGEETIICLENVYERDPEPFRRLFAALASPRIGFCLDTGHFNCFSQTPLEEWLEALHPYLRQIHLHDNLGQADQHLPVGDGTFPFRRLFALLRESSIAPVLTVESHREEDLPRFAANIEAMALL